MADAKHEQCTGPVHAPADPQEKKKGDNGMGLEACEKEGSEKLKNRNVMKTPAAQQKPAAKTKPVKKACVKPAGPLKLGCRKCRGCVNGELNGLLLLKKFAEVILLRLQSLTQVIAGEQE